MFRMMLWSLAARVLAVSIAIPVRQRGIVNDPAAVAAIADDVAKAGSGS